MLKFNVTEYDSYPKESVCIFRLQESYVFVSADLLMVMGLGRVVLVVYNYCSQRMVVQYLLPSKMGLTAAIVECGIYATFGWIN